MREYPPPGNVGAPAEAYATDTISAFGPGLKGYFPIRFTKAYTNRFLSLHPPDRYSSLSSPVTQSGNIRKQDFVHTLPDNLLR